MSRARSAALAALLAASGCAHDRLKPGPGEEGEIVESEGWAPDDAADPLGTERRALADAQKKAVERVAGVFIAAKTRVDRAVDVDQRMLADVDGLVRRYDVLSRRREGGFLKTRIRALVSLKRLGDEARRLGLDRPAPPPGNPRAAVLLKTRGYADAQGGPAAQGLRSVLLARGFTVVDAAGAESDLVFKGDATALPVADERLGGLHSARARVQLKALRTSGGKVMGESSQEAGALDLSPELAAQKALAQAASQAAESLLRDLAPVLKSRLTVDVKVSGLSGFSQVRALLDEVRMNPEVAAATLSDYREGLAELAVVTDGLPGPELGALIARSPKLHLAAQAVSAYAVELKVK